MLKLLHNFCIHAIKKLELNNSKSSEQKRQTNIIKKISYEDFDAVKEVKINFSKSNILTILFPKTVFYISTIIVITNSRYYKK